MLTQHQIAVLQELQALADLALVLRARAQALEVMYFQRGFSALDDTDIQSYRPEWALVDIVNGVSALQAILTALGNYSSGSAGNLLKLVDSVGFRKANF